MVNKTIPSIVNKIEQYLNNLIKLHPSFYFLFFFLNLGFNQLLEFQNWLWEITIQNFKRSKVAFIKTSMFRSIYLCLLAPILVYLCFYIIFCFSWLGYHLFHGWSKIKSIERGFTFKCETQGSKILLIKLIAWAFWDLERCLWILTYIAYLFFVKFWHKILFQSLLLFWWK